MTILITGANRGIGLALAELEASQGEQVIATSRTPVENKTAGIRWETLEVTDPDSYQSLAKKLAGQPIDLLICNAGIYPDRGHHLDTGYPLQMWAETFAVNVTGVFLTIKSLLPNIRAAKGKIAIISSQMASDTKAPGGAYIYRSSKAAVLNLGRNLATDLKQQGIAVGIYHPGWVRTEMGGDGADISVEDSAKGLAQRFDALSIQTTGCFECWDGRAHPY
jgi:NAD(P)-dependent dehydrogenase (short-subunit alcohol dehydrogenase family)